MGKEEKEKNERLKKDGKEKNRKVRKEKEEKENNFNIPDFNNKSMFFDVIYVVFVNRVIFETIDEHHKFVPIQHESINIREM